MKTHNLKTLFKATTLAFVISAAMPVFAKPTDQVIAIVGDSAILKSDLDQGVAETLYQINAQNKDVPDEQVLRTQVLNQLVLQRAQLEQVKRFGIKVDENALNDAVLKIATQSGSNSLSDFQQKLDETAPGAYAILRERVATDLAIQHLRQQQVMSRIRISDQDVENFLKSPEGQAASGSQVHVLHLRVSGDVPPAELKQAALNVKTALNESNDFNAIAKQLSNAKIQVEGADMGFRPLSNIPTELAARVTVLNPGQTSELIQVKDGIHILKLLERKSNEQKTLVPQFKARHILIKTSEVVTPESAQQMIESIYNRINAGEDFATLAATYSNDPGSARDGGSLGWVTPGMMVPQFDEIMQNIEVGKVSQPFETQFGWHILQVTDTRQQDMSNEHLQRMARQTLGERQFDSELDGWLRELRANTYVEIKDPSLDPKAKKTP